MLEALNDFLSGKLLIVLIVGLGGYFTLRSRFVQFRHFGHMFSVFKESIRGQAGQLSSFQALMLSLAGRVGAGNIAGVGIAVTLGGPGAVFWMWVTALVGMSSSFFECTLAQVYKRADGDGLYRGGPSYYIEHGLKLRWMAVTFAVLLLVTYGFAFNGLQSFTVTHSLENAFGLPVQYTGIGLAVLLGLVFIGGIKRIAAVSDLLVPVKTLAYIGVTLYVIATQIELVPGMLVTIVKSAFGLEPAFAGLLGSAIVMGVKRGVFANEAGLGSAPNVAAVAAVKHPAAQGVVQAFSVFLDTFVICTCTALLILLSGFYTPGFEGDGIVLTQNSLAAVVGDWGRIFVSVALSLFVFTCILYNYYLGENALQFLAGRSRAALLTYRGLVLALICWGSMQNLGTVFAFADITMTCLAFVNLLALALLIKVGLRVMRDYDEQRKAGIDQPVFDASKFTDLDLDRAAWPINPVTEAAPQQVPAGLAESHR
ncbi:AGCS family alanine or glycine:cation symporter [Pseudomonas sp. SLBN-26]|uniref:AGCS sodium/alanine/glycine symporter n=1 Tax=Metapseudomonas otitidis TaxID=319939 RepID=A0A1I0U021_9GAMM|nr:MULTISPECIES: alanine/glycine:cation symporter family protein [Pseudomonas]KIV73449.1 putative AGCS sodium/alanine/glycine symporter [Pseudomonas sp. FeS53a]MCO7557709.1 alanine:cation symporter family protein [Pseudomonas otitidis]MCP1619544.1 AGCS family alanine or glycine:cation symporter [Pseudomonas otitidis]MDI6525738.1 alanine/glycine:cation symporter family protein [Pseudomonas otitidis]MDU9396139.1 alanine/glycine:cation symporter family protein [Pseudomonas sp. zfem003]